MYVTKMLSQLKELRFIPYLLSHPINGFYELKREKRGSPVIALLLMLVYILLTILSAFLTSYMFNGYDVLEVNVPLLILPVVGLYALWCVSSWCLTSLFDGEGSFYDICIATAYSMIPLLIGEALLIPLSYALTLNEASLYDMIGTLMVVWFVFMLFISTMVTHQYSFSKTILICICTVLGMCIMIYIALLFINLL
ncbi:MAG: YIP1 family protein, partial [Clostridia bacterium]|nr:YIP1 family protein [Clostridia bacterium]